MRWKAAISLAAVGLAIAAAGYVVWKRQTVDAVPPGFAVANGRLEAREIDVAAKYGGRIVELPVHEGDDVAAGAIVARLDTAELDAAIIRAEAQLEAATHAREAAAASVIERESQQTFATQELARATFLSQRGHQTEEMLDRRRSELRAADATLNVARALLRRSEHDVAAAEAESRRLRAQLEESVLKAPRATRVLYRLAEPGEVLAPGGKAVTLVDLSDMYMTVFLADADAGAVAIGAPARIIFDGVPDRPVIARVTFVSPTAQFTPKTVETREERTKLVFRIKASVVDGRGAPLKSGMPGVAYIRLDENKEWLARLK